MTKTLVTGGSGFVGHHLVRRLVEAGNEVVMLVRPTSDLSTLRDLLQDLVIFETNGNPEEIENYFKENDIDSIFHLATCFIAEHKPGDLPQLIDSNFTFGIKICEAMARHGVKKIVNATTSWQYYHSDRYRPLNLYSALKQAFENVLLYYHETCEFDVANVILFDNYGDNDSRGKLMSALTAYSESGDVLELSPGGQLVDLLHVSDVVDALLEARRRMDSNEVGFRHFLAASGSPKTLKETVEEYCVSEGLMPKLKWGKRPYRKREVFDIKIYDKFENLVRRRNGENK